MKSTRVTMIGLAAGILLSGSAVMANGNSWHRDDDNLLVDVIRATRKVVRVLTGEDGARDRFQREMARRREQERALAILRAREARRREELRREAMRHGHGVVRARFAQERFAPPALFAAAPVTRIGCRSGNSW